MSDPVSVEPPAHRIALPASVTLAGLFCGMLSMSWAADRPYAACCAIIAAGLFDMIDGRVARMANARSSFGAEIDSLADIVSFGVAPAWLSYQWALAEPGATGIDWWLLFGFVFAACSAVRLARFNVGAAADTGPTIFFGGLPTPAGALFVTTVIMVAHELGLEEQLRDRRVIAPLLVVGGALMVSNLPLPSYKTFPNRTLKFSYYGLIVFGLTLLLLGLPGGAVLFGFVVYYILSGLVNARSRKAQVAEAD